MQRPDHVELLLWWQAAKPSSPLEGRLGGLVDELRGRDRRSPAPTSPTGSRPPRTAR